MLKDLTSPCGCVLTQWQIRARRFEQDIRLQRISIGLEAKNEEEKHLRHTLTHILSLEKAKLRDEHRTTSSILKQIQKDHAERESATETLYVLLIACHLLLVHMAGWGDWAFSLTACALCACFVML